MVQDEGVLDGTLELDNFRLLHRTVVMYPLEDGCIIGTVLFDRFVAEIDYLTPAVRLYAADAYQPAKNAVNVPLVLDRYRRPTINGRLALDSGDTIYARLLLFARRSFVVWGESSAGRLTDGLQELTTESGSL